MHPISGLSRFISLLNEKPMQFTLLAGFRPSLSNLPVAVHTSISQESRVRGHTSLESIYLIHSKFLHVYVVLPYEPLD